MAQTTVRAYTRYCACLPNKNPESLSRVSHQITDTTLQRIQSNTEHGSIYILTEDRQSIHGLNTSSLYRKNCRWFLVPRGTVSIVCANFESMRMRMSLYLASLLKTSLGTRPSLLPCIIFTSDLWHTPEKSGGRARYVHLVTWCDVWLCQSGHCFTFALRCCMLR